MFEMGRYEMGFLCAKTLYLKALQARATNASPSYKWTQNYLCWLLTVMMSQMAKTFWLKEQMGKAVPLHYKMAINHSHALRQNFSWMRLEKITFIASDSVHQPKVG